MTRSSTQAGSEEALVEHTGKLRGPLTVGADLTSFLVTDDEVRVDN